MVINHEGKIAVKEGKGKPFTHNADKGTKRTRKSGLADDSV